MKKCAGYKTLIVKYLENALDGKEKQKLEDHISNCSECRREIEDQKATKAIMKEYGKVNIPEPDWNKMKNNITEKIKEQNINTFIKRMIYGFKFKPILVLSGLCVIMMILFNYFTSEIKEGKILAYHKTAENEYKAKGFVDYVFLNNIDSFFNKDLVNMISVTKQDVLNKDNTLKREIISILEKSAGFEFNMPEIGNYKLVGCRIMSERAKQIQLVYKDNNTMFSLFETKIKGIKEYELKRVVRIQNYEGNSVNETWLIEWRDKEMRYILVGEFGEKTLNLIKEKLINKRRW